MAKKNPKTPSPVPAPPPPLTAVQIFRNFIPETDDEANASGRIRISSNTFFPLIHENADFLEEFRQVSLMRERDFVSWAKKRGVQVWGSVFESDIYTFWLRGLLRVDGAFKMSRVRNQRSESRGSVLRPFDPIGSKQPAIGRWNEVDLHVHPFRIYPLTRLLGVMEWKLSRSSIFFGKKLVSYASGHVNRFRQWLRSPRSLEQLDEWNGIADLAILLEPIYWPTITSVTVQRGWFTRPESGRDEQFEAYRLEALGLLRKIPKARLAWAHHDLRLQAANLDRNHELYLLLRASSWKQREELEGDIGAAMWLRHMAEVIRLGYDEIYEDRLVHEDEASGHWFKGAREWLYGSEYPLDNPSEMVRRILQRFGIASSPRVRFYVEGDTEEGALKEGLKGFLGFGIEVINLRAQGWTTWLKQELENDVRARRLSLLMLDTDREDALRALRERAKEGVIVGHVFKNHPDFEFFCFSLDQLVQAIQNYEEAQGSKNLSRLSISEFEDVTSGDEFATRYKKLRLAPGLKGQEWGRALMRTAFGTRESSNDLSNKLVFAVTCAIRAINTNYEGQQVHAKVDPETLEPVDTGRKVFGNEE